MPELSIVLPCYNEAKTIGNTVQVIDRYLSKKNISHEIVVANDGSHDQTASIVRTLTTQIPTLRLLDLPHQGKGGTVREGMLRSSGRLALFLDADLSTPIEELPAFLQAVEKGVDIVIASRELPGSKRAVPQPPHRRWVGWLFRFLIRTFFGLPFPDTQCGFKLFTRHAVDLIFRRQQTIGFIFDVELLYLAKIGGLKIVDLPVTWTNRLPSRVSLLRDLIPIIRDLIRLRLLFWKRRKPWLSMQS